MDIPCFRYESFSFRRETTGFPRDNYIFWQRKPVLPAPPDRSVGRRQGVCAAYRLPLPVGEVPAGRRGPSQSPSVTAPPKGEPRALHVTPPTSNLPHKLLVEDKGCDGRAGGHNALKPQKHPLPDLGGDVGFWNTELRTVPSSSCRRRCPCPQ